MSKKSKKKDTGSYIFTIFVHLCTGNATPSTESQYCKSCCKFTVNHFK